METKGVGHKLLSSERFPSKETNPFISELYKSLPPTWEVDWFSWRTALCGRWELFHVHWPEYLMRGRSPLKTLVKKILFGLLVIRLAVTRRPVVWTFHNAHPHDGYRVFERYLFRLFDSVVSQKVHLTPPDSGDDVAVVIPHGIYPAVKIPSTEVDQDLFSVIGLIRRYKAVERVIEIFMQVPTSERTRLLVRGKLDDNKYLQELRRVIGTDARVIFEPGYLSEAVIQQTIRRSVGVFVLYPELKNSGVVLLSLSLGVPVVATESLATKYVQDAVGGDWLYLIPFEELTPTTLGEAMRWCQLQTRTGAPDLSKFTWHKIGEEYGRLFSSLV